MKKTSRKNIYEVAKYFYYFLKCIGMAFYEMDVNLKNFKISKKHYISFTIHLIVWFFLTIWHILTFYVAESGISFHILNDIWHYHYLCQIVTTIPIMAFNFVRKQHVWKILELLHNFDEKVEKLKWTYQVQHTSKCYVMLIVLLPTMIFFYNIFAIYRMNNDIEILYFIKWTVFAVNYVIMFSIPLSFDMSCYCILKRFKCILKNLR
jgi:hypothetical protein